MESDFVCQCYGMGCPIKQSCERFKEPVDRTKDFFATVPYNFEKKKCEHFIKNEQRTRKGEDS